MNSESISDKVVLITGAARRIGRATAIKLHSLGYSVIIHCLTSTEAADELVDNLNRERPDSALSLRAELKNLEALKPLIDEAVAWKGRLDVLINNASSFYPLEFSNTTAEDFAGLFDTNVRAPFFLAQHASSVLKENNGVIINITDIHGERPLQGYSAYSMTKAALIAMTKSLAKELAPEVRVNGISPGAIMWPEFDESDLEKQKSVLEKVPLGRLGATEHIAETAAYILSCDYLSGQIIAIDGGRSTNQ